jgi:hypothetical protein
VDLLGYGAACFNRYFCDYDEGASVAESVLKDVHSEAESNSHYKQA